MSWEDVLARSRGGADPAPGVRERVRERLQAELSGSAPSGGGAAGAGGVASLGSRWSGKVLCAVLGLCAGFVLGRDSRVEAPSAARALAERPTSVAAAPPPDALAPAPAGVLVPAAPPSEVAAPGPLESRLRVEDVNSTPARARAAQPTLLRRAIPSRSRATPRALPAPSDDAPSSAQTNSQIANDTAASGAAAQSDADRLREALAYLQRAHALLRAGDPNAALGQLAELDRRVPSDLLAEERDVTLALAWCDSGDPARASRVARRLLAQSPASVYARSLAESCVGRERLLEEMRQRTSKP